VLGIATRDLVILAKAVILASFFYLTPRGSALLEKKVVPQPIKKFSAFYGIRNFITMFTTAHHLSLS
jgi:hypothetical protein